MFKTITDIKTKFKGDAVSTPSEASAVLPPDENASASRLLGGVTPREFSEAVLRIGDPDQQRPMKRIVQVIDSAGASALRDSDMPAEGRPLHAVVDQVLHEIGPWRAKAEHLRFFGFIPGPASPLSALGEFVTAMHNIHAGGWLQSSGASAIEVGLIDWLAARAGMPASTGGLFVSGGSMANLTALTVARDQKLSPEERSLATAYVSDQTHSSVAKSLQVIGFLPRQIRRIPTDAAFRMDMVALADTIEQDREAGLKPFAVIASAGTTNTGSIDPLRAIREICDRHDLWMHVDGAYGASAVLSPALRPLLDGIGEADSLSWDAHKWLFQTYGCSMILVRNRDHLVRTFHTKPEYLRDAKVDSDQVNFWDMGVELTRPARALKLWFTLQVLGINAIVQAIEHGCRLAEWVEDELTRHPGWEVVSPAQLAIVDFRMAPLGMPPEAADDLNRAISRRAVEDGFAVVLTTQLRGRTVLRICAIHPDATEWDMRETVRKLHAYGIAEVASRAIPAAA